MRLNPVRWRNGNVARAIAWTMRRLLSALLAMALLPQPASAQRQVTTRTWVENGVTWTETTVTETIEEAPGSERIVGSHAPSSPAGIAAFGPFRVLDRGRAALVAETDSGSPAAFEAMLRLFPQIRTIEMADCPGTLDDVANLRLGRMIRGRGIATHVPPGGSVRSGAVELFLAGAVRTAAPDAEFAVHSWLDEDGRQARDFAAGAPVNRSYLSYYQDMGMTAQEAARFYALTNSVPHERALWLRTADIARYAAIR